jgi:HEPN domain-containing protein
MQSAKRRHAVCRLNEATDDASVDARQAVEAWACVFAGGAVDHVLRGSLVAVMDGPSVRDLRWHLRP